jgi:hypothetical protein
MSTVQKESEVRSQQHLELEAAGWQLRFEADANRAAELIDLYRDLGYEVTTRKIVAQEIGPECAGCAVVACQRYVALYTRGSKEGAR